MWKSSVAILEHLLVKKYPVSSALKIKLKNYGHTYYIHTWFVGEIKEVLGFGSNLSFCFLVFRFLSSIFGVFGWFTIQFIFYEIDAVFLQLNLNVTEDCHLTCLCWTSNCYRIFFTKWVIWVNWRHFDLTKNYIFRRSRKK